MNTVEFLNFLMLCGGICLIMWSCYEVIFKPIISRKQVIGFFILFAIGFVMASIPFQTVYLIFFQHWLK